MDGDRRAARGLTRSRPTCAAQFRVSAQMMCGPVGPRFGEAPLRRALTSAGAHRPRGYDRAEKRLSGPSRVVAAGRGRPRSATQLGRSCRNARAAAPPRCSRCDDGHRRASGPPGISNAAPSRIRIHGVEQRTHVVGGVEHFRHPAFDVQQCVDRFHRGAHRAFGREDAVPLLDWENWPMNAKFVDPRHHGGPVTVLRHEERGHVRHHDRHLGAGGRQRRSGRPGRPCGRATLRVISSPVQSCIGFFT